MLSDEPESRYCTEGDAEVREIEDRPPAHPHEVNDGPVVQPIMKVTGGAA
jgi:hypothetical protein